MTSLGSILSIAREALLVQQTQVHVTSQNIANAETEGYSRQRAVVTAADPQWFPFGNLGTGVVLKDIGRARDTMLDASYRREQTGASSFGMQRDLLTGVEQILGEPSENGLSATLDQFWNAWSDLSNDPTRGTPRSVVRQRGAQVAGALNTIAGKLSSEDAVNRTRLSNTVASYNQLARQIGAINVQIVSAEVGGHTAADLRDARDRLVDQMSQIADTSVAENANGTITVHLGTITAVDGASVNQLELRTSGGKLAIGLVGNTDDLRRIDGQLGAMLDFSNTSVPTLTARLDQMAQALVTQVNSVHRQGWTAAGDALGGANWNPLTPPTGSNVDFFDPAKVTAATISLSAAVQANAGVIAAGNVQGATGNNSTALALGSMRSTANMVGTQTFADYYSDTVSQLALDVREATDTATVHETLASQADTRRQSVSGVSTDEELIELTRQQQAYAAASKLVTTVDEMMQTLLTLKS
jgi:flagellar hook-associated protein 1 FlgK